MEWCPINRLVLANVEAILLSLPPIRITFSTANLVVNAMNIGQIARIIGRSFTILLDRKSVV